MDPQIVNCVGWQMKQVAGLTLSGFYRIKEVISVTDTVTTLIHRKLHINLVQCILTFLQPTS